MTRLRYPVKVEDGRLAFSSNDKAEKNLSVLATIQGERVYWPFYGNPLSLFDPDNSLPDFATLVSEGVVTIQGDNVSLEDKNYVLES